MAKIKSQSQDTNHSELDELREQLAQAEQNYLRARADYTNLEQRVKQQQSQYIAITTATILGKFVDIVDNLERAAKHIDDPGLNMVTQQLHRILVEEGVEVIEPSDEAFDPEIMECVESVPGHKDQVVTVNQKGYRFGSHLIRPAKVKVGNGDT